MFSTEKNILQSMLSLQGISFHSCIYHHFAILFCSMNLGFLIITTISIICLSAICCAYTILIHHAYASPALPHLIQSQTKGVNALITHQREVMEVQLIKKKL